MTPSTNASTSLINTDDCILAVIDIQDFFLRKYDNARVQEVVAKAAWLTWAAGELGIPVVAMAEDMQTLGPMNCDVADSLPDGTVVHDKDGYSLAANPEIL